MRLKSLVLIVLSELPAGFDFSLSTVSGKIWSIQFCFVLSLFGHNFRLESMDFEIIWINNFFQKLSSEMKKNLEFTENIKN